MNTNCLDDKMYTALSPIARLQTLAFRLGFEPEQIRGVELTYYNQIGAYKETAPTPRSLQEAIDQENVCLQTAYAGTLVYIRRTIDDWHKPKPIPQADGDTR